MEREIKNNHSIRAAVTSCMKAAISPVIEVSDRHNAVYGMDGITGMVMRAGCRNSSVGGAPLAWTRPGPRRGHREHSQRRVAQGSASRSRPGRRAGRVHGGRRGPIMHAERAGQTAKGRPGGRHRRASDARVRPDAGGGAGPVPVQERHHVLRAVRNGAVRQRRRARPPGVHHGSGPGVGPRHGAQDDWAVPGMRRTNQDRPVRPRVLCGRKQLPSGPAGRQPYHAVPQRPHGGGGPNRFAEGKSGDTVRLALQGSGAAAPYDMVAAPRRKPDRKKPPTAAENKHVGFATNTPRVDVIAYAGRWAWSPDTPTWSR